MTPGERQYDVKLIKSARSAAKLVAKRSQKIALIINQLCDRLDALSSAAQIETQPASTPAEPVTGNGETQQRL